MAYSLQTEIPGLRRKIDLRTPACAYFVALMCLSQVGLAADQNTPSPGLIDAENTVQTGRVTGGADGIGEANPELRQKSAQRFGEKRTRIRIPGSITEKSRQMILDAASPKTRALIIEYENEIRRLNETRNLSDRQRQRRDALIRTRFKLMRDVVKSHPGLHSDIRRVANGHRYRQGVLLARKIMNNPEAYQRVLSRADPETAIIIRRNNDSLRRISTIIREESSGNRKVCNAHRMDALYKRMSSILDNQVGALERSGFVRTGLSE